MFVTSEGLRRRRISLKSNLFKSLKFPRVAKTITLVLNSYNSNNCNDKMSFRHKAKTLWQFCGWCFLRSMTTWNISALETGPQSDRLRHRERY